MQYEGSLCFWPWSFLADETLLDHVFNICVEWNPVYAVFGLKMPFPKALLFFMDAVQHAGIMILLPFITVRDVEPPVWLNTGGQ